MREEIYVKSLERRVAYLERELMLTREKRDGERFKRFPIDGEMPPILDSIRPHYRRFSPVCECRWFPEEQAMSHHLILSGRSRDLTIGAEYWVQEQVLVSDRQLLDIMEEMHKLVVNNVAADYAKRLERTE